MSASRPTTRVAMLVAAGVLALAGAGCAKHDDAKGGGSGDNGDSAFIGVMTSQTRWPLTVVAVCGP